MIVLQTIYAKIHSKYQRQNLIQEKRLVCKTNLLFGIIVMVMEMN